MTDALNNIIRKLQDPRYLFLLGVMIILGTLSFFNVNRALAWVVAAGAFAAVLLFTVIDYLSVRRAHGRVALVFPRGIDPSELNLRECEYKIRDPANPRVGSLTFGQAGAGWVCVLPKEAKPTDSIEVMILDAANQSWRSEVFIPELKLPPVTVHRDGGA